LLGTIAVVWMGLVFVDTDALAFTVTAVIGGIYAIGSVELLKFRQATSTLSIALVAMRENIADFDKWLDRLDPSLRNAVRLRVEGERVGLPAPVLTPYFLGLLVMLGLLGTFVGMVDTLRGAVIAFEGTTDLQAIRDGLVAPIKGLGLAFGTSVAGVATSAMLGLMSTLSQRRRMLETRRLDTKIPTHFQDFSLVHSRRETFRALRNQTRTLPAVAEKLDAMTDKLSHLGDLLIENQDRFHASVKHNYLQLADSMDNTFKENLTESIRRVGETIKPIVQDAMTGLAQETQTMHRHLTETTRESLDAFSGRFAVQSQEIAQSWKAGVEAHHHTSADLITQVTDGHQAAYEAMTREFLSMSSSLSADWRALGADNRNRQKEITESLKQTVHDLTVGTQTLASRMQTEMTRLSAASEDLIHSRSETEAAWLAEHRDRMAALTATIGAALSALRDDEERRGQAAVERLANLESVLASHLATLGQALEAPMTRLIQSALEAPRAAVDVIEQLRREASKRIRRDNRLLEEHRRIVEELDTLSTSLALTSDAQREAIEQLVNASKQMLEDVGRRFSDQAGTATSNFCDVADSFAGSAVELASLGDAFSTAVDIFHASNGSLIENMTRIEESLDNVTARSDDQLGYYVAQARDLIDHSILSQKEIFKALRELRPQNGTTLEAD